MGRISETRRKIDIALMEDDEYSHLGGVERIKRSKRAKPRVPFKDRMVLVDKFPQNGNSSNGQPISDKEFIKSIEIADPAVSESDMEALIKEELLKGVLSNIVLGQLRLQESGRFDIFLENPLLAYLEDPFIQQPAIDFMEQASGLSKKERKDRERRVRGKMFEQLAYGVMASNQRTDRAVISPEDTLEIFALFNPKAQRTINGSVQKSLMGVYVPDGLIVDVSGGEPVILKALEYTKTPEKRVERFQGMVESIRRHDALLYDSDVCLVHPMLNGRRERYLAQSGVQRMEIAVDYDELTLAENEALGWHLD